jgi:hypothetical protein
VLSRLGSYLDFPKYMEPNTMYAEAGPVIETPLSAAATIQEMFLQDWGHAVRVFPAVPTAWRDAAFADLRSDGAFLVSGVRRDAKTAWVRITSLAGQPLHVVVRDWDTATIRAHEGAMPRVTRTATGEFDVSLARGASVTLAEHANSALPTLAPVALTPGRSWPALHGSDSTTTKP